MNDLQQQLMRAFGDASAMAELLAQMDGDLCGRAYRAGKNEIELLGAFLSSLQQRGEAFLEIPLADACSSLFLWARSDAALCLVQLCPSLRSSSQVRQQWEARYSSSLHAGPWSMSAPAMPAAA